MSDMNLTYKNGLRITFRVSMVLGLLGTIIAGSWYAGAFSEEVETMKREITRNTDGREDIAKKVISLQTGAAARDATAKGTEQRLDSIDNTLRRIEAKIDRATQRFRPD